MTEAGFPDNMRFFTVSTAGHVDHGKTSLLRALTGIDPDRLKEEKERQMTTDLGFAFLQIDDAVMVGFVDVPGHGKFLKNMLAGVGGIDMALLVVAADEGPMPQTVQHVRILSLLGVQKAVVAITKADVVEDVDHLQVVSDEIKQLLARHDISLLDAVTVSSVTGEGIDKLKRVIGEQLRKLPQRDTTSGVFLPVDRVFSKSGFGTVVTGTLVRGRLAVGDQVVIGPDVSGARVRRLETHGRSVTVAQAGQRVACNLVLKENKALARGHLVLAQVVPSSKTLIAALIDRPAIAGDKFAARVREQPIRLYHGTAEYHGRVRWAETVGASTAGGEATALIVLEEPIAAQPFDRFLIRLGDESIFGGRVVLREKPRWIKRVTVAGLAEQTAQGDLDAAALNLVSAAPHSVLKQEQLSYLIPAPEDRRVSDRLVSGGRLAQLADVLLLPEALKNIAEQLQKLLRDRGSGSADGSGVTLESARVAIKPRLDRDCFQALVDQEVKAGRVIRAADKLTLPGAGTARSVDAKLEQKISSALEHSFCLDLKELAAVCSSDVEKVKSAAKTLEQAGGMHLINYEFAISDAQLQRAHRVLADIWQKKRNISPSDFRETLGTTRKYAMALLQHFDDHKITRRLQDGRVLLKSPDT